MQVNKIMIGQVGHILSWEYTFKSKIKNITENNRFLTFWI